MTEAKKIVRGLLRSLRGNQSSASMSQSLGFTSNQYHRWETGHSTFRWKDLIDVSKKLNLPIHDRFLQMLVYSGDPEDFNSLVKFILPGYSQKKMAALCHVSPKTFSNWVNESNSPPLEIVIEMMSYGFFSVESLCRVFVTLEQYHSSLKELFRKRSLIVTEFLKNPWIIAILCRIDSGVYDALPFTQVPKELAKETGLNEQLLQKLIQELLLKEILRVDGQKLSISDGEHVDLSGYEPSLHEFINFWSQYSLQIANQKRKDHRSPNKAGYIIFNASSKDLSEVQQVFAETYQKLREISDRNKKPSETYVFTSFLSLAITPKIGEIDLLRNSSKKLNDE